MKNVFLFLLVLILANCSDLSAPNPVIPEGNSANEDLNFRSDDCAYQYEGVVNFETGTLVINGESLPLVSDLMRWSAHSITLNHSTATVIRIETPGFDAWCQGASLNNIISGDLDGLQSILSGDLDGVQPILTGDIDGVSPIISGDMDGAYPILSTDMDGLILVVVGPEGSSGLAGDMEFRLLASSPFL